MCSLFGWVIIKNDTTPSSYKKSQFLGIGIFAITSVF